MTLPDLATAVFPVASAFALSLAIAWTHRHTFRGTAYTQDYAHTLVIIATVTAVLVKVIGANLAIGLAMFAAFSVIRFPRNLGQSSDLAFMFFAIAVAMVAGIVSPGTAAIVAAVGCGLGLALHHGGFFIPSNATHLLTLSLASDADFETMLDPVFGDHAAEHRLLGQRLSPDGQSVELRFALALRPGIPTARFIEALHHACGNRRLMLRPAGTETESGG